MLDRHLIRTQPELVHTKILRKGIDAPIQKWVELDKTHRGYLTQVEQLRADLNRQSRSIGQLMAQGQTEEAEKAKVQTKEIKDEIDKLDVLVKKIEQELESLELRFPNIPSDSVPYGEGPEDNVEVRAWGNKPILKHPTKPHWEIATELGLLDLPRASKISGSGFALYTGWGARLQRALFNFMIDHQTLKRGYREIYPPYLVTAECLIGTGNLPKFEEDLYKVNNGLYLIPTAEVPVTNIYREEILDVSELPMKMAAFSGCFRSEAGAAGKDTRGLLRIHQFDKVEIVKYTLPEKSDEEHELLVQDAESVLQLLGLHYRVMLLCTQDMGDLHVKSYDLELWSPGMDKYLEISSCSNYGDYQARRANIRFRRAIGEKPEFIHTLNGSGLATPRLFAALLETYYQEDGSILIPEPLREYVGTDKITAL